MPIETKFVKAGSFQTLASFWNTTTTAFFRAPAGAQIKIYYGYGWAGASRQQQTLDGTNVKSLHVSAWSFVGARIQINVLKNSNVTYSVEPGHVALTTPGIQLP